MDRRTFVRSAALVGAGASVTATGPGAAQTPHVHQTANPLTLSDPPIVALKSLAIDEASREIQSLAPMKTAPPGDSDIPEILQPIDIGSEKLLTEHKNANLTYSPMEVEYLINTLDDHIVNCINLREKAQQLEVLAVAQRLELNLEKKTLEFLTAFSQLDKDSAGHIAAAMYDPSIAGSTVSGSTSESAQKYYTKKYEIELAGIKARSEIASIKLSEMKRDGSGNNNVYRFDFIKEMFNLELVEAYNRARSIAVGLKHIYNIDAPVPAISDLSFLNKLSLWHKSLYYRFERRLMRTTSNVVMFGLRKNADALALPGLLSEADFVAQRGASNFKFKLTADEFDRNTLKLKNPRIRGLELLVWTDAMPKPIDYLRAKVELPDQSIRNDGTTIWANKPSVILPMVSVPQGVDIPFQSRREVHNADPIGDWSIQIEKRTLTDKDTTKDEVIKNLFVAMRISSEL